MKLKSNLTNEILSAPELAERLELTQPAIYQWFYTHDTPYCGEWERLENAPMHPVRCVETGEVYSTAKECAQKNRFSKSNFYNHLNHKYPKTMKGKHYEKI